MSSFVQLKKEHLSELLTILENAPVFYWVNDPNTPIPWQSNKLESVSELVSEQTQLNRPIKPTDPIDAAKESLESSALYAGHPMVVDGSTHFLAIELPSREHPMYSEIRELLEHYRFKLEPRNRKWWLRDRHQTLNFLSSHWEVSSDRFTSSCNSRKAAPRALSPGSMRPPGSAH